MLAILVAARGPFTGTSNERDARPTRSYPNTSQVIFITPHITQRKQQSLMSSITAVNIEYVNISPNRLVSPSGETIASRQPIEFRLRWRVCPDLFWLINRDVVPDHDRTIMLSHRMGERSVSIPVLLDPRIVNAPKSDARRCAQVCGQHRLPNDKHTQMRV